MSRRSESRLRSFRSLCVLRGELMTYSTGSASAVLTFVPGSTFTNQVIDDAGSQLRTHVRDFLIEAALLVIAGTRITPRNGHTITTDQGSTFELAPIGNGEPCWRWSDESETVLRIHTQFLGKGSG